MRSTLLAAAESGPWAFGWDFFVALGTIGLAFFTWRLAAKTRDLAAEGEADRRARWRPVLLPITDTPSEYYGGTPERHGVYYNPDMQMLHVRIRNSGPGPALHVRAQLERPDAEGALSRRDWSLGALGPGETQEPTFENAGFAVRAQLLIDYRDMADRAHATAVTIERINMMPRAYDVRVFEDHNVTELGDAVYQSGLRDVRPPASRPRRSIVFRKKEPA
ncbi:hypothetical protein [Streptomyces sp. NPDC050988]|uniref:hypothetical protein n=1 Tax=Streptomyces sp. NPDC050988 TaxID=3365637 RepID=UPI003791BCBA